tara:strand:+ start:1411 stop:1680 length:270 start_codon:yes stop_codon:yes gene_type:complete
MIGKSYRENTKIQLEIIVHVSHCDFREKSREREEISSEALNRQPRRMSWNCQVTALNTVEPCSADRISPRFKSLRRGAAKHNYIQQDGR